MTTTSLASPRASVPRSRSDRAFSPALPTPLATVSAAPPRPRARQATQLPDSLAVPTPGHT
jgi:hypothetical protein